MKVFTTVASGAYLGILMWLVFLFRTPTAMPGLVGFLFGISFTVVLVSWRSLVEDGNK